MKINTIAAISYLMVVIFGISSYVLFKSQIDIDKLSKNDLLLSATFDSIMITFDLALTASLFVIFRRQSFYLSLVAFLCKIIQSFSLSISSILIILSANNLIKIDEIYKTSDIIFDYGMLFFAIALIIYSYQILKNKGFPNFLSPLVFLSSIIYIFGSISNITSFENTYIDSLYLIVIITELLFIYYLLKYVDKE